jgi:two-component system OmpR family response regulator
MARTILVVDDERTLRETLAESLEQEGFVVVQAADGRAAVEAFRRSHPDLILLDLMLPEISGTEVCRIIRAESGVPILMLTAKDGEHDEAEALDTGADDFLSKPFSFVVLLARLRALMRRGTGERPPVLSVGTLTMDPATHEVKRGSSPVTLTTREYSLLEYLMRHAGDLLSKADIMAHVWDWEFDGDSNIVEVYVGYLRKKIDAPFDVKTLCTVRGAGYRLVPDE